MHGVMWNRRRSNRELFHDVSPYGEIREFVTQRKVKTTARYRALYPLDGRAGRCEYEVESLPKSQGAV
jgi:hypothetical protein